MPKFISPTRMNAILAKALPKGATRKGTNDYWWTWHAAGNCQRPVHRVLQSRAEVFPGDPKGRIHGPNELQSRILEMDVPCRLCDNCLARRAAHWRIRIANEYRASSRTWLVTLTLTPSNHYLMLSRARSRLAKQGFDFDQLPEEEQFALRHAEITRDHQLYLKRLRKQSGARVKFILVMEKHKSGLPHYHLLIHEYQGGGFVRKSLIQDQWKLGFSTAKLVTDVRGATYVAKYLTKSHEGRVRPSAGYGYSSAEHVLEHRELAC